MKKRVLFLFKNTTEVTEVIKFSKYLKDKYSNLEMNAMYVRDIIKYDIQPTSIEGVGIQGTMNILLKEYRELENRNYEFIEKNINHIFEKVYSKDGETVEIALEEMKAYDLIIVVKNKDKISSTLKDLLRYHYKPMIILSITDEKYEYNIDDVLMLDNGDYRANKTIYSFINFFEEKKFNVLRVNVEEKDRLKERFLDLCNIENIVGDEEKIILERINNHGIVLMGDLQFPVFIEKITGNIGIKIIENSISPIYIG